MEVNYFTPEQRIAQHDSHVISRRIGSSPVPVMAASLMTVVREMPSSSAMAVFGTPSAASRLMYAESSNVITLPDHVP